jgi:hypothetical protein
MTAHFKHPSPKSNPTGVSGDRPLGASESGQLAAATRSIRQLQNLLEFEGGLFDLDNRSALHHFLANRGRQLTGAGQAVLYASGNGGRFASPLAIAGVSTADSNAPLVRWLVETMNRLEISAATAGNVQRIRMPKCPAPGMTWPFEHAIVIPLATPGGRLDSILVLYFDQQPASREKAIAQRVGQSASHALRAIDPARRRASLIPSGKVLLVSIVILALLMFVPVPLRILANAEIVPQEPFIVAAPFSGAIRKVHVLPNAQVAKGDLLVSLETADITAELEIARRDMATAQARYHRASQGAFSAADSRRELAIVKAEYELAKARMDHMSDRLERTEIRAEIDGIVIHPGSYQLTGVPVSAGERIMRIADPAHILIRLDVEPADSIPFPEGAPVRLFPDSDPLNPIEGRIALQSYEAVEGSDGRLVFQSDARIDAQSMDHAQLGQRGTAQISTGNVSLWFYLLRKPIAALRQIVGI